MYAAESLTNQRSIRTEIIETSRDAGWTSTLVARHRAAPLRSSFETFPTPDITLVVALEGGSRRVGSFESGRWRDAIYNVGSAGLTAPGESDRLRWSGNTPLEMGHLYLPHRLVAEATEALRRIGQHACEHSLSALVFEDPSVATTIRALLSAARSGAPNLYAEQAMTWLATHLLVTHAGADPHHLSTAPKRLSDKRLARVIAFMRARYGESISLQTLASEAGISKFHFSRLFRERTGMSPHAFLVNIRMTVARRLLRDSDLSVAEVARAAGYTRPVQFGVAFKSSHGMTATAFRGCRNGSSDANIE